MHTAGTAAALPWADAWMGAAPLQEGLEEEEGKALLQTPELQLPALPLAQGAPQGEVAAQEAAEVRE